MNVCIGLFKSNKCCNDENEENYHKPHYILGCVEKIVANANNMLVY